MKTLRSLGAPRGLAQAIRRWGPLLAVAAAASAFGQTPNTGNDNPTGNSGLYNATVTTAGLYNAYTGNSLRAVPDLNEPGAAGSYGLTWVRVSTSRFVPFPEPGPFGDGGSWHHGYQWRLKTQVDPATNQTIYEVHYPDGGVVDFSASNQALVDPANNNAPVTDPYLRAPKGVQDRFDPNNMRLLMSDGGAVTFVMVNSVAFKASYIDDPYHARTLLSYNADGSLAKVVEPGGRSLVIGYGVVSFTSADGTATATANVIGQVTTGDGQVVSYQYTGFGGGSGVAPYICLTSVIYVPPANGLPAVQASYTYTDSNDGPGHRPLLWTANDPHYPGALTRLRRGYNPNAQYGVIQAEISDVTGTTVDSFNLGSGPMGRTETRGDAPQGGAPPSRTFAYSYGDYQISAQSDFEGLNTLFAYDPNKNVNQITDRRGNATKLVKEPILGRTKGITRVDNSTASFEYGTDPLNPYFLTKQTNERQLATTYTRDPATHLVTAISYPDSSSESYTYKQFSLNGSLFYKVKTHTTKKGAVITYLYDQAGHGGSGALGLLTSVKSPKDVDNAVTVLTQINYDALDRPIQVTDPRSNSTYYEYSYRHQVTKMKHQDNTFVSYEYDIYGNRTSLVDELTHRWSWTYDEHRRPMNMSLPVGSGQPRVFQYTYERANSPAASHTHRAKATVTFPSGKKIKRIYRNNGWLAKLIMAPGTPDENDTLYGYNQLGQVHTVTQVGFNADGSDRLTTTDYDNRNRVQDTVDNLGHTATYTYYPPGDPQSGLLKNVLRPDGRNIQYIQYDGLNRPQKSQDAAGDLTSNSYDAAGNPASITDPNTHQAVYAYDLLNRIQSLTYADNSQESYTYDEAGNLATFINRKGNKQTYRAYDNRNRTTGFDWDDQSTPGVTVVYDDASRLKQFNNSNSSLSYTYNDANEMLSETQALANAPGVSVAYHPDLDGFNVQTDYPSGYSATYQPTNREQIASVGLFAPSSTNATAGGLFGYFKDGGMSVETASNSTSAVITEDNIGRTIDTNIAASIGGYRNQPIDHRQYGYDPLGRMTWFVRTDSAGQAGDAYLYDSADRLQSAYQEAQNVAGGGPDAHGDSPANPAPTSPAYTHQYAYDGTGNRTQTTDNNVVTSYGAVNSLNQYPSILNVEPGPSYDSNGNLHVYGNWTYLYDASNRLISASNVPPFTPQPQARVAATSPNPNRTSPPPTSYLVALFSYDAKDRCVNRTFQYYTTDPTHTGGPVFSYQTGANLYYDGWKLLEERGAGNPSAMARLYVYGSGGMGAPTLSLDANGAQAFYHTDARGYVTKLTDINGAVTESYQYDAFGSPRSAVTTATPEPPSRSHFLFGGQLYLPDLGLYDLRHRIYSPGVGRFLQPDPLGFGGGSANVYAYCGSDPVNKADPSGLFEWSGLCYLEFDSGSGGFGDDGGSGDGGGDAGGSGVFGSFTVSDYTPTGTHIPAITSTGSDGSTSYLTSAASFVGSVYGGGGGSSGDGSYSTPPTDSTPTTNGPGNRPVYSMNQNYPTFATNPLAVIGIDILGVVEGVLGNAIGLTTGIINTTLGILDFNPGMIGDGLLTFREGLLPRFGLYAGAGWGIPETYLGLPPLLNPIDVAAYNHDVGYEDAKNAFQPDANEKRGLGYDYQTHILNNQLVDNSSMGDIGLFGSIYRLGLVPLFNNDGPRGP